MFQGGNSRGAMGGNSRGRGGSFSSWSQSAYDSRPAKSSMGSSLDWANSEARAKMLERVDYSDEAGDGYYNDGYGRVSSAPGPADYHSTLSRPEYVSYPVPLKAKQPGRQLYGSPKPRGGGPQVGKRPSPAAQAVQQSTTSGADAKRAKLSSMNELLESSQRDMSSLSSRGNSELSKVLEKQQKLLEMQSKLIAEMAGGANGNISKDPQEATTKLGALMEQEFEVEPVSASVRGAHQRGGSTQRRGGAPRGGPGARRGGHRSIWDTLGSHGRSRVAPADDSAGQFPTAGRGTRGRGESPFRGRGVGAHASGRGEVTLARGRGEGTLARGRGEGTLARGRGESTLARDRGEDLLVRRRGRGYLARGRGESSLARGRGEGSLARGRGVRGRDIGPYGRGRELEDVEYGKRTGYAERDLYTYRETRGRGALRRAIGRGVASSEGPDIGRKISPYEESAYVADPYADDPYAEDPYYTDPYAEDPYAADPYARDPYAAYPYGEDPYASDPYAPDPYARDPYEADPYAEDPYTRDPYAADPYAIDPYGEDPYAVDPYARDPYSAELYSDAGLTGERKLLEGQRRDPRLPLYDGKSVESRMQVFIGCLFEFRKLHLPISAIETTRHERVDTVKVRTHYETFEDPQKTPSTLGMFRINGVILAVEQNTDANDVKYRTYKKALYNLLTMSVSEMLANSLKLRYSIPKTVQQEHHLKSAPSKVIGNRLQHMVDLIRDELYNNQYHEVQPKLIHEVDVACGNAQAGITLVYTKAAGDKMITCELYADDLMIASAQAYKKMTAYHFVYKDAKKYLMNCDKTSLDIVRENKRLQDVNPMANEVVEIQFKGKNHERGSNLWILKTKFPNTWRKDVKESKHLVVMMHTHDRASIPYKVLEDLANMNHMWLQFVTFGPDEKGPFRSVIFLQGELVGDGDGYSKAEAKDNAARKALSYFTENNPVVQVGKRIYNKPDYNFAAVKEAAQKMQTENPTMFKDWKAALHPQPAGDDPPLDDLTPYVDKILEDLVNDYIATQGLEEIILDHDFPACFITMLIQMSTNLDVDIEKKDGDGVQDRTGRTVIQKSVFKKGYPLEVVKILQESNNQSGRYTLTQWIDDGGNLVKKES